MRQNKHIVRVNETQLSLYNTIRLAEEFAGIPNVLEERIAFIRQWAMADERKTDGSVQQLLFQSLGLKTKRFAGEWKRMEQRLREIRDYALNVRSKTDKERLYLVLKDLEHSGFVVKGCDTDELTLELTEADAKKVLKVGAIAIRNAELEQFNDDGYLNDNTVIVNPFTYSAGPYVALVDALKISGLNIVRQDKYEQGKLRTIEIGSAQNNEFREALEKLALPEA